MLVICFLHLLPHPAPGEGKHSGPQALTGNQVPDLGSKTWDSALLQLNQELTARSKPVAAMTRQQQPRCHQPECGGHGLSSREEARQAALGHWPPPLPASPPRSCFSPPPRPPPSLQKLLLITREDTSNNIGTSRKRKYPHLPALGGHVLLLPCQEMSRFSWKLPQPEEPAPSDYRAEALVPQEENNVGKACLNSALHQTRCHELQVCYL